MDDQKVDMFILTNSKYFQGYQLAQFRERLLQLDESKWSMIQFIQFKDPILSLVISLFVGTLGIDRFFIGDVGLGVAKLLTCGGLGIWTIVDWFLIMDATKAKNLECIRQVLY